MTSMTPREVMTLAQGNLSRALERKAVAADAMLHVRNTRDHLGNLRYWLATAEELKTLKARKQHLTKALDCLIDAHRQSCREVLSGELVTARTSQSIRTAISYWQTKVAMPKQYRKEAIKLYICERTLVASHVVATMSNDNIYKLAKYHHKIARKKSYGFNITFAIWARALVIRAMYPRC